MDSFGTLAGPFFQKLFFVLLVVFAAGLTIYKLQSLLRKKVRLSLAEVIEDRRDIKNVLTSVMKQKERFRIRLDGRKRSFNSSLMRLYGEELLIDALFPEEGNTLIRDSHYVQVDFYVREKTHKGMPIPYTFRSAYLRGEEFKNYPAIRITLPDTIRREQKRSFHRIDPPLAEPLYVTLRFDNQELKEKISNISAGGCGFYFNGGESVLQRGQMLDAVEITLPGNQTIHCRGVVNTMRQLRNTVLIEGCPYHYYCGIEFKQLVPSIQNVIIQYVIEQERKELRRLSRGFD